MWVAIGLGVGLGVGLDLGLGFCVQGSTSHFFSWFDKPIDELRTAEEDTNGRPVGTVNNCVHACVHEFVCATLAPIIGALDDRAHTHTHTRIHDGVYIRVQHAHVGILVTSTPPTSEAAVGMSSTISLSSVISSTFTVVGSTPPFFVLTQVLANLT